MRELNEATIFPCTSCGLCCQHIGHIEELAAFDRGDGVCVHLKEQLCAIYENRPDICRVDEMYHKVYHAHFSKEAYYRENKRICEELQQDHKRNRGE